MEEENKKNRDDFTKRIKEQLAKRVGYLCSNPDCKKSTVGPSSDVEKSISYGIACHMKAAAENGPRYDVTQTSIERKDIRNGIWLCTRCSKKIDTDWFGHSVELLENWKYIAENNADVMSNHGKYYKNEPFIFYDNDIANVIEYFSKFSYEINEEGDLYDDLHRPQGGIIEKNKINSISDEYYNLILKDSFPKFYKIEKFLNDPINDELYIKYQVTAKDLNEELILYKKNSTCFEENLNNLYKKLLIKDDSKLTSPKIRGLLKVFLHYMYFYCDLGEKYDKTN
jgi:hypothetical protein